MEKTTENFHLSNLQALRGVAALLVFLFHAKEYFNGRVAWGDILFQNGNIGVPIFFVLSGFIMVYSTQKLAPSANSFYDVKQFLIKRGIRIIPLYYFLTIVFLILENNNTFLNDGIVRLLKVFLFIPIGRLPPLYVGWTLNYEMFFYLIFALSLLFAWRYIFLYGFFILLLFIPLFIKVDPFSTPFLFLISNSLMLHFLLGVFLGNIYPKIKFNDKIIKTIACLGIVAFIGYYFSQQRSLILDLIFCGILVFSLISADKSSLKLPKARFLNYLGDISYSIYLVHPLFLLFLPVSFSLLLKDRIWAHPMLDFSAIAVLTILTSMATHWLIEKRFTTYLRKHWVEKKGIRPIQRKTAVISSFN